MSGAAPASVFAIELVAELIRRGVRDFIVCPGSRSQALALALAAAEQVDAVRLHVRLDERSAGYFAIGVARETGMPAPVIVTSGTAVANLMPAVLEANEGRVPLLVITADRPPELRGIRSNQTTAQAGLFSTIARLSRDVSAPELGEDGDLLRDPERDPGVIATQALAATLGSVGGAPAGPVQLNIAFREPLSGTAGFDRMIAAGFEAAGAEAAAITEGDASDLGLSTANTWPAEETFDFRGDALAVAIAGAGAGLEAEAFAHAAGIPLLAEVVSGARFGRQSIAGYSTLLDDPELGGLIEQAIVFGHPTLTRQIPSLLRRPDVDVVVVDPFRNADHFDPNRDARVVRAASVAADHDPSVLRRWLGSWVVADRELQQTRSTLHEPDLEAARATGYKERSAYARAEVATMREPISRELLTESIWRATWPHDRIVLAASRLVRVLDSLAPARRLEVHSNRGLAGIDGTVATALGIAASSQSSTGARAGAGSTRVLLGDLALLHDAGSLLLAEGEIRPRIQLFVGNDGGGSIFDGLEVAGSAAKDHFDRVMYTPQQVSLESLAASYGWEYQRIETRSELERLLTAPVSGPALIEVPLAR